MNDAPPWLYHGFPITPDDLEGYVGFVYVVHNLETSRRYVGKKLLTKSKIRIVKGKRKRSRVASDWETYFGSNTKLLIDVATLGRHRFMREIIRLCKSRGECSYWEAKMQFEYGVLESDTWYNDQIRVRVHRSHLTYLKPGEVTF